MSHNTHTHLQHSRKMIIQQVQGVITTNSPEEPSATGIKPNQAIKRQISTESSEQDVLESND